MYLEWLILVAGVLGVLLIHELGHLVAARFFGLKVSSLSIGLGPEIIGFTDRSGTRWKVALLPMGGSCAFSEDTWRSSTTATPSNSPSTLFSPTCSPGAVTWQSASSMIYRPMHLW